MLQRLPSRALLLLILAVGVFLRVYHLDVTPTGLRYDEAFNGVDALGIVRGDRPIFLTGNFGREALFIYLQALSIALLGTTDLALRLVAAICGILTLPLTYVLTRRLFGSRVALLALAWLAVCLWHVIFSRVGLRTISLPLFCAATFYCLWRGLQAAWSPRSGEPTSFARSLPVRSWPWFLLGGFLLGLTQYTYTAARFAPVIVLAFAGYLLVLHRCRFRPAFTGLVLAGVASLITFAPEGSFFLSHPNTFAGRASQVWVWNPDVNYGSPLAGLIFATRQTLAMFSFAGDPNWDRDVPNVPVFGWVSSAFFVAGLLLALRRFRRPAYAFTVLWIAIMLVPGFLAVRDAPNFLHLTGLIPAIFIPPALSADWLWDKFEQRATDAWRALPYAVASIAVVVGAYATYQSYFGVWAHSPEVAYLWNSDRWLTVEEARVAAAEQRGPVLAAAGDPDLPLQAYAMQDQPDASRITLFDSTRSLIFPPGSGGASYLFPSGALPPSDLLRRFFADPAGAVVGSDLAGDRIVRYQLGGGEVNLRPERAVPARLGPGVELLGFDLPADVRAGSSLDVRWYWRIVGPDRRDLAVFNQLFDANGQLRGQLDGHAFLPNYWPVGTAGISTFAVPIDPAATTGGYRLLVGAYDRQTMQRLAMTDPRGQPAGDQLPLGPIKVHGRAPPPTAIAHPRLVHLQDQIDFRGAQLDPSAARPGTIEATLVWAARGRPSRDYTVFVHLLDAQGHVVAQADGPPQGGTYPTSIWDAGETIADVHPIRAARPLPPGTYQLEVGLYQPDSGRRLPVIDATGHQVDDRIVIPDVVIP